jgi:hypothetical protein
MSYKKIKHGSRSFREEWINEKGELHRESGPAQIYYNHYGSIRSQFFCINGKSHRESGPAQIYYNPDGSIYLEDFYLSGECLGHNKKGFWALWDRLDDKKRQNQELLKYLVRFS